MSLNSDNYLGVFSSVQIKDWMILQSSALYDRNIPDDHHIYFIVGFDKYFIESITTSVENENQLTIEIMTANSSVELTWNGDEKIDSFSKSLDNRSVIINDEQYHILDLILKSILTNNIRINTEILYIGQAKGIKASRNTADRLENHETLQKILAECHDSKQDKDIRIISLSIVEKLMWTTLTTLDTSNAKIEDIYGITENGFEFKIPESSMINLVEAKLINFFKPKYNEKYKNNIVPSKKHNTYKEYNGIFNMMCISLTDLSHFYFIQQNISFDPITEVIDYKLNSTDYMEFIDNIIY